MNYMPSEVFASIIKQKKWRKINADPIRLHSIFYQLFLDNPEIMKNFKFIKRRNPYSPTLDDLITWFQLDGVLSHTNPNYEEYQVNKLKLDKLLPRKPIVLNGIEMFDDKELKDFSF